MGEATPVQEYHVVTTDNRIWSWSAASVDQLRRDFFERGRLILSFQLWSEWEQEQAYEQQKLDREIKESIEKGAA